MDSDLLVSISALVSCRGGHALAELLTVMLFFVFHNSYSERHVHTVPTRCTSLTHCMRVKSDGRHHGDTVCWTRLLMVWEPPRAGPCGADPGGPPRAGPCGHDAATWLARRTGNDDLRRMGMVARQSEPKRFPYEWLLVTYY